MNAHLPIADLLTAAGAIVAVCLGVTEAVKRAVPWLHTPKGTRYLPLVSIAVGMVLGAAVVPLEGMAYRILAGALAGLMGPGVYTLGKPAAKAPAPPSLIVTPGDPEPAAVLTTQNQRRSERDTDPSRPPPGMEP